MLCVMYERWASGKGASGDSFGAQWVGRRPGEASGLKSGLLKVAGPCAFGLLRREAGVHRLGREVNKKRHTSFASVTVTPQAPQAGGEEGVAELKDSDLRVETFKSGGKGGQSVNTTDSAVRVTHLPTGVTASCQMERSQHRNRATCLDLLRSRLLSRRLEEAQRKRQQSHAEAVSIGFGSDGGYVRSYVLHPYRLVKDARTGIESSSPEDVLRGDLDAFLEAGLVLQ